MKPILTFLITFTLLVFSINMVWAAGNVVAVVNGTKLTQSDLDDHIAMIQTLTRQKVNDQKQALDSLIDREIMYQEAKKKKIDKDPKLKVIIKFQTREIYNNALIKQSSAAKPITDTELKQLYDEKVKSREIKEYKVHHILFKKENAKGKSLAKSIIVQLDTGKDFSQLARDKSEGPSANKGGDIGWLNPRDLRNMAGFAQALSEMKKGRYSKTPIQSDIGWHVLKLDDVRTKEPPTFEQLKKQLHSALLQHNIQTYVKSLRGAAKVVIKLK